jgi:hypothetical protein
MVRNREDNYVGGVVVVMCIIMSSFQPVELLAGGEVDEHGQT